MSKPTITKRCCKCKEIKQLSNFHKSKRTKDNVQTMCKSCNKEYQKVYARKYRQTETSKAINSRYQRSEKGIFKSRTAYRKNIEKKRASARVRTRVRTGLIPAPSTIKCVYCHNMGAEYHHYLGYHPSNWYIVESLCHSCHSKIHNPRID